MGGIDMLVGNIDAINLIIFVRYIINFNHLTFFFLEAIDVMKNMGAVTNPCRTDYQNDISLI